MWWPNIASYLRRYAGDKEKKRNPGRKTGEKFAGKDMGECNENGPEVHITVGT